MVLPKGLINVTSFTIDRIVGMFGGVNVWRIANLKEIGKIKFGKLIGFIHKDVIYKLNFSWLKFGEPRMTHQIH